MVKVKTRRIIYAACFLFMLCWSCSVCAGKTFKIAFLAPGPSSTYPINSDTSVAGVKLALRSISKNPNILNGHKIAVKFFDTKCNAQSAVTTAMMAKNAFKADAIVGPPCHGGLKMVAQLGTYWNLPILNWYHTGNEFRSSKTYPTLVRMLPPLHLLSKSLVHVLTQNNWLDVSVLFIGREPWSLLEDPVREDAAAAGVQIHGVYKVASNMSSTALNYMYQNIQKVARAVVMICPFDDVRHFLLTAVSAGLTNGKYAFIHLDPQIYTDTELTTKVLSDGGWKRGDSLDGQARKAYESVIHVVIDPTSERAGQDVLYPRSKYTDFSRMALYESKFTQPQWNLPSGRMPDVYSAYLCDAVVVWSVLVDMLDKLKKDYRDGKLMAAYMRRMTAAGATGHIELNENLDRLGEVFVLEMQPDGNFQPKQLLKFNKTDGYSVTNILHQNQLMTESTRRGPSVVGQVSASHKTIPVERLREGPSITTKKVQTTTSTTSSTTSIPSTASTTSSTTSLPSTASTTSTTTSLPSTASSTTTVLPTTTHATTVSLKNQPDILARLKAIEEAMKNTQPKQLVKSSQPTTTLLPPAISTIKTNRKKKLDPHLGNFDVRLKKKRKIYAKAQKILDGIRATGDPNVAEFLRLALDRLNAEEDLLTQRQQRILAKKRKDNLTRKANMRKITIGTTARSDPVTVPTVPPTQTVPTNPSTTARKTAATTQSAPTYPSYMYEITAPEVTTTMPTTRSTTIKPKPTTSQTTSTPQTTTLPTTIPTTFYYYDQTTTDAAATTTKPRRKNRKKGKQPKRRLRQKWLNEVSPTTPAPTTPIPGESEVDIIMADNKMISSIVDQVANKLMGKVTGEIQTLKQSIKTMQSTIAKNTSKNDNVPIRTDPSKTHIQNSLPNIKADINRSLIKEISANVLTKLSGVSWLEQKPEVPQAPSGFQQPQLAATIAQPIDKTKPIYQIAPVVQTTLPPRKATRPTTARTTPRRPAPPKILGSWMSGLPPAVSMQLFAVETVIPNNSHPKKSQQQNNVGISMPFKQNIIRKTSRMSTRNNPFNLRHTSPLYKPINLNQGVTKSYEIPAKNTDLFQNKVPNVRPQESINAVPIQTGNNHNNPAQTAIVNSVPNQPVHQAQTKAVQGTYQAEPIQQNQNAVYQQPNQLGVVYHAQKQPIQSSVPMNQAPSQPIQHATAYQTPKQPIQPANLNMESIIANITNSVLAGVNKQIDSLKTSMTSQIQAAPKPQPAPQPQPQQTTSKPVYSLRQIFHKTASPSRNKGPSRTRIAGNTQSDIINSISDAVIKQLNSGHVNTYAERATNPPAPPPTTMKPQEHEPEPQGSNGNTNGENGGGSGGNNRGGGSLADNIASKVFGKMNAKLDALSKSVNTLQRNIGQQELEEIPPEMFGRRGNQMGGEGQMMQMPNMPMGMMPMPFPPQSLRQAFVQGTQSSPQPKMVTQPMAPTPPHKDMSQMNFKMPTENSAAWTPPVNPWMNRAMPQGNMWGSSSNSWWT